MTVASPVVVNPELGIPDADLACAERYSRDKAGRIFRRVTSLKGDVVRTFVGTSKNGRLQPQEAADSMYLRNVSRPSWEGRRGIVRVADLFSGCGAMSLGIAEACRALDMTFVPVVACDTNETALRVYSENFEPQSVEAVDLGQLSSTLNSSYTPLEVGFAKRFRDIDVVLAGPPCQGHSNLNNHTRRTDPKNGLYFKVARFAEMFRPKLVLVENVPTVIRDHQGVVEKTRIALEGLGYRVSQGSVSLAELGVAQSRRRHLMIALRKDLPRRLPSVSEIASAYKVKARSVLWAIGDLADEPPNYSQADPFRSARTPSTVTQQRIEYLFDNEAYELPDQHRPDCHRYKDHSYGSVYGRMYPNRPAPTITSGFATMGQGRFVHPTRRRTISAHEAARIQFIPDFFSFDSVSKRAHLAEMIGNAVPPKLSYVFGLELLR